jgi:hypothetical protein
MKRPLAKLGGTGQMRMLVNLMSRTYGPLLAGFALLSAGGTCRAASSAPQSYDPGKIPPVELVRQAVQNEVAANNSSLKHMFRSRKQNPQGSQTRLYVETQQATAGMTVAYNDKPLSPDQMRDEENRLAGLASSPEQLSRKHAQEAENAQRTLAIMKALPEAFLYEYAGEVPASDGVGGANHKLVRLKFHPNPAYQPPSHTEQVLVGMEGALEIDPTEKRIAQIDGTLSKEVSFGWGILGHLDQGGHFLVEQRDVGKDSWEISHMALSFTGKILLFKSLSIKTDEVFSDFRSVPSNTTFAQGVEMLKQEEAKLFQNPAQAANAPQHSR